ncbi:hypothetical protein HMPREF9554_01909 [Treponema phagedenis F0421]|nr:hypothetical protein HMPREF9554_01909 [Treponema phagedenis F0421]
MIKKLIYYTVNRKILFSEKSPLYKGLHGAGDRAASNPVTVLQKRDTMKQSFSIYIKLICIYKGFLFSLKRFTLQRMSDKKPAGIITFVLFALFLVYIFASLGFLAVVFNWQLYDVLARVNQQRLLFVINALSVSVFVCVFEFLSILSAYHAGAVEEYILSLPIKPSIVLLAKYTVHALRSICFSLFMFMVLAIVYTFVESPPAFFYFAAVLSAIVLPLPILGFCYAVHICVFSCLSFLKNKKLIKIFSMSITLIFAVGIQFLIQFGSTRFIHLSAKAEQAAALAQKLQSVSNLFEWYLPIGFAADLLTVDDILTALPPLFGLIAIGVASPMLLVLLANRHAKTLPGFSAQNVKKLQKETVHDFIQKKLCRHSLMRTLVYREIISLNREPAFLLGGPFSIILFPLIIAIPILARGSADFIAVLHNAELKGLSGIIIGLSAAFLSASTQIALTAVSRDAKNLAVIKSLPISWQQYFLAKFIHGFIFSLIATAVSLAFWSLLLFPSIAEIFFGAASGLALAALLTVIDLYIDIARPFLYWDNPTLVMKRNINRLISFFISLTLPGLLFFLAVISSSFILTSVLLIFLPGLLTVILLPIILQLGVQNLKSLEL